MWAEAVEQACNLMVMEPYPGYQGRHFSIPCRNLVPKPVQKPHPPLWVACASRDTMLRAARHGMGALTFAFLGAAEARHWVDDYYRTLERECVPIGHAVNPNVAVVCPLSCHRSEEQAILRGLEGFLFFNFSLGYYYNFGRHRPGLSDVWQAFNLARRTELPPMTRPAGIGTPAQLREDLTLLAQAGVDQVVFLQQTGRTPHDQIMESLELFAREVMPGLVEDEPQREANKRARLAGAVEAALGRKRWMAPIDRGEIPEIHAYGRGRR
jgi:alkanesulfonate monooxygenase SsuD/methylene tetrahydromethanopterin reductase-like flavin-dependent oxidoreductase (luciferase family)